MPQAEHGDGPWGEAIEYWLKVKRWKQADLRRAFEELPDLQRGGGKNTVSTAVRGLDVNTSTLRGIAKAFGVPLEEVLVSPDRRSAKERERELVEQISAKVYRDVTAERERRELSLEEQKAASIAKGERAAKKDAAKLPRPRKRKR
jgi:hypothetical protein